MTKLHKNAALSLSQRKLIRKLYLEGQTISSLSKRFGVNRKCSSKWAKRTSPIDKPSGPKKPKTVITDSYRSAVISHRKLNPDHGPITIAYYLKENFSFANRGTVLKILSEERLAKKSNNAKEPKKTKRGSSSCADGLATTTIS